MLRVGRPRTKGKDLPLGVYPVKSGDGVRYYVRPVNEEMRRIFAVKFPGKGSAALGQDKTEARKKWVGIFVMADPTESEDAGTCGELIARYERDILPGRHEKTKAEETRYCATLKREFGARRYAKSEVEASTGKFVRALDITQYLRREEKTPVYNKQKTLITAGRAVASNKEIQLLSRIFRLAKTTWGYTEYNPCLQIEYNTEEPRGVYVTDEMFKTLYESSPPILQCMMDLAQMAGTRRGMLLNLTMADVTDEGLWLTPNKKRQGRGVAAGGWVWV